MGLAGAAAGIALHYAYYNFCKRHGTIRCTPEVGMSEYLQNLRDAVSALQGCGRSHASTGRVIEFYEGQKVSGGATLRLSTLSGHPIASEAFAWAFDNGTEPQYVAVLKIPPINNLSDAAAMAAKVF